MTIGLLNFLDRLRSGFWFIPGLMVLIAVAASVVLIEVDFAIKDDVIKKIGFIYAGGPEGARAVLAAIAGSMITVAGVVFSVTVVILSLTSQQFGPRILRTFIRDRSIQFVLGSFVATFVYCLLVLRTVRGGSEGAEVVPYIAVTAGILFAIVSIGVLIFFVHHAAASIQATSIIAAVGLELDAAIDRLYPQRLEQPSAQEDIRLPDLGIGEAVPSVATGYVQGADADELVRLARSENALIVVAAAPGDFVVVNDPLARIHGAGKYPSTQLQRQVRNAFVIGENRTAAQDADFLFRQLTEIAVRALSPGTNDPFTACECIHRLTASLRRLAGRSLPSPARRDEDGQLRLIAFSQPFTRVTVGALGPIRRFACSSEEVLSALLRAIASIAGDVRREEDRAILVEHARAVLDTSKTWPDALARQNIEREFRSAMNILAT